MDTIKEQYNLLKEARETALSYYDSIKYEDLTKPVKDFNNAYMQYLILHIANVYLNFIQGFAFKREFEYFTEENVHSSADIRKAFDEVNKIVDEFLEKYNDSSEEIEGEVPVLEKKMKYPALQLITHVMTHEFHHKGQVMTMSRILGYTPPDADIIRF